MRTVALIALCVALAPTARPQAPAAAQQPCEPLTGTVVDPDGKPVAQAMVELWRAEGRDMSGLDLAYSQDYRLLSRVPTSRNGAFGLQLPRGLRCQLRVDQPPFAHWLRDDVDAGEPLRIELQPPATFAGKVVLPDGKGTAASLRAWNTEVTEVLSARTAADGTFRCERLPAGAVTVEVVPDDAAEPEWQRMAWTAGETTEVTIACPAGERLLGHVMDRATGKPIAGARVGEGWVLHRSVASGADGAFDLPGFGSAGHDELHCVADGYVRMLCPTASIAAGKPRVCDFTLDAGNAVAGTLVAPGGAVVAGAYVAAVGMNHDGRTHYHYWVSGRTGADGAFRLQGVRPDLPPTLLVRKDGWATLVFHLPAAKGGVHDAGRIEMRRARLLTGQVVDGDGKPLMRVSVGLWGGNEDRCRMATLPAPGPAGSWPLLESYVNVHKGRTDSRGAFAFGDLAPGDYRLTVYGPDNEKLATIEGIAVKADSEPSPVTVTVAR